jgi:hypothetical protein
MTVRVVVVWACVVACAWESFHYVRVFRSDSRLAAHAVAHAPQKPRVWLNYGRALVLSGHSDAAVAAFERAERLAMAPHIPIWDREDVRTAATGNRRLLAALRSIR